LCVHAAEEADHRLASVAVLRAQAQLARYYALADPGDRLALTAALADDFAARYGEALLAVPPQGQAQPEEEPR
jgi:hypothetical protein